MIFGPLMIAALLALFWVDDRLDRLDITGTWLQALFAGRTHLPAGLVMLGAMLALIVLVSRELHAIFRAKGIMTERVVLAAAGVLGAMMIYTIPQASTTRTAIAVIATLFVLVFLLSLMRHCWGGRTEGAVAVAAAAMFTMVYLGVLPGFLIAIRRWHSAWIVAAVILVTKSCDIGAYFTGRAVGRHKLIPWLSPGKTWEGLAGGVVLSSLVAALLAWANNTWELTGSMQGAGPERVFRPYHFDVARCAIAGALMGVCGQLGDLTASLFKRDAGIKDSGSSIPGYGGLIDIADSPVVVAPLAYWLLTIGSWLSSPGSGPP